MTAEPVATPVQHGARDTSLNIHQRMLAVMEHIEGVTKTGFGPQSQGSYRFAPVGAIKDAVRDECIAHGIMPHLNITGRDVQVLNGTDRDGKPRTTILATVWGEILFVNVDDPSDVVAVGCSGQGIDSQDKALSKATTSADKYALLHAFQIPTDDPDETGEDVPTRRQGGQQQRPPQQSRPAPQQGGGEQSPFPPDGADDGYQHPQQAPRQQAQQTYSRAPGGQCPKHNRAWKQGNYGWYCSAKDNSTEKGYCILKPDAAWVQSQER